MKPKILIVEDEEAILKGLTDVFLYHGYEVASAMNGREGLNLALTGTYHLIILDIMLPEMDGLTICNHIRDKDRSQPIIMLTAKGDEDDVVAGLKQGADDYVTKPFSIKELLARVEAVIRRSPKVLHERAVVSWESLSIDPQNLVLNYPSGHTELTRREVAILLYLIKQQHRPVSRQELLKEVWGYRGGDVETRTVDIHMAKLRKKLEPVCPEGELITTVRGEGYRITKGR